MNSIPSTKDEQNQLIYQKTRFEMNPTVLKEVLTQDISLPHNTMSDRDKWSKDIEFLLSCICLSVGLGNVWRFPFTALENGGGAFIIPYIIVLLLVGRPIYFMEVAIGQFCSRACIKAFDFAPIMKGVAYGQVFASIMAGTYYASIMGLTLRYLLASVNSVLPWAECKPEWGTMCFNSGLKESQLDDDVTEISNLTIPKRTSAEYYFTKVILREVDSLDQGIGVPNLDLVICLAVSWIMIALILIKGIKSSGKFSYFLALFPYVTLTILLMRAIFLPGALNGIIYFLKPKWNELLNPKVWYAAVTQVFFSLAVCFGPLIMYASYNNFNRNVHKDVIIITSIDSFTSILAGCIIFGILGNLAYETKQADISNVVKGGAGLAFISYPDAIAKFTFFPQVFSLLFFMMLFVLGIGSNIGMASTVTTVLKDQFPRISQSKLIIGSAIIGFLTGIVYMTPGGQYILNLVDYFGPSFIGLSLAIAELIAVGWIYGVKRLCRDIEFMTGQKTGKYWRICWGFITPGLMTAILVYTLADYAPLKYNGKTYSFRWYVIGWTISAIGILQFPLWAFYYVFKQPEKTWRKKITAACKPTWGPQDLKIRVEYEKFCDKQNNEIDENSSFFNKIYDNVFG